MPYHTRIPPRPILSSNLERARAKCREIFSTHSGDGLPLVAWSGQQLLYRVNDTERALLHGVGFQSTERVLNNGDRQIGETERR